MEDCVRIGANSSRIGANGSKEIDVEAREEHVRFATDVNHGVGLKARDRIEEWNDGIVQVHQRVLEWTDETIVLSSGFRIQVFPSGFRFQVDSAYRNISTDF